MLWKILSGLAAIALGVGVWASIENRKALTSERDLAKRAKDDLKSVQQQMAKGGETKARWEKEFAVVEKQRDEVKVEVAKVQSDGDQKVAEVDVLKKQVEEITKQLKALEDQISKAGDMKKLLAKVEELTAQKKAAEAAIANQQQQLALADERVGKIASEITRLDEVERRARTGVVESSFTARVTQPYTGMGFVILNKGNLGGMFANAMLDVKRGSNVVAKLKVRDVEQTMSVADLVPGSLAQGTVIRSGDLVVASKAVAPPPPAPAPTDAASAVPGGAAPAAPAPGAPAADPFGAPAAPGMAAPAPAPAAADPFGAPAAPAGGMAPAPAPAAPPAAADPFAPAPPPGAAPAPAPAPGAAPAPPAAPMAADPFAPPPAK